MLKTVFTIGTATQSDSMIKLMMKVASRLRLNSSHFTEQTLKATLEKIQQIQFQSQKSIPVIVDLLGLKMRIGQYPTSKQIPQSIQLVYGNMSNEPSTIPVPSKFFFQSIKENDKITMHDAKIIVKIQSVGENRATATVIQNGPLSSNQGINRYQHPIPFEDLLERDKQMIDVAQKFKFVEYAFSFALTGNEADKLKKYVNNRRIIAKVERPETFQYLNQIDQKFDELWLCRGDLGAQAGIFNVGLLQNYFIKKMKTDLKKPCYLAGEVLEHMTFFPLPTRSELAHLFDIQQAKFEGIVLSDETAIGNNPEAIVEFFQQYEEYLSKPSDILKYIQ